MNQCPYKTVTLQMMAYWLCHSNILTVSIIATVNQSKNVIFIFLGEAYFTKHAFPLHPLVYILWLISILCCIYTKFSLSIHQLMDIWIIAYLSYYDLRCYKHGGINESLQIPFCLGIFPGVGELGHTVDLFSWISGNLHNVFHNDWVSLHFSNSTLGYFSLHILARSVCNFFG